MNWHDWFYYSEGLIFWKVKPSRVIRVGWEAGRVEKTGYKRVGLDKKIYFVHRVVWEMFNGPIPKGMQVDHINHDNGDDRIENLRLVTCSDNNKNKSIGKNSTTGVQGVTFCKRMNKYKASVRCDGKYYHCGYFNSLSDAAESRRNKLLELGFHENHE
ncbi:HNH endonuclease [Escherichia phage bV_EcoS_AHP24]|uniref:HNH endonuclease n=2 Tax=Escherichia phage vB_EcoS_AHS24 TaxID=1416030 RepID=A0A067YYT1_9CAUD|nr:HNH endonuclease [Escherichia phage vB_EcoS_AHS24]AHI60499.1 HNH endonuclease [Escherichia phage bV_EcoS_AHP24]AHI60655.1 HNH endonuclease [Escherichia phage vB_EcoS_AHS24]